jgi:hypothetical protein
METEKEKQLFIISIILLFLLFISIGFVNAYDIADLQEYYTFDNDVIQPYFNSSILIDSINGNNLTVDDSCYLFGGATWYCWTTEVGISGNGLRQNPSVNALRFFANINNLSSSFSINYWVKNSTIVSLIEHLSITNGTKYFTVGYYGGTAGYVLLTASDDLSSGPRIANMVGLTNDWNMITLTYDGTNYKNYINGVLINTTTINNDFGNSFDYLAFGSNLAGGYHVFDELSIWSTDLNIFDITTLYSVKTYNLTIEFNGTYSSSTAPVCVDSNTLCNNPILIGTDYYCEDTAIEYCSSGCINLLIDNTTNGYFASSFNSCETYFDTVSEKHYNCNELDINFKLFSSSNPFLSVPWFQCYSSNTTYTIQLADCSNSNVNEILYDNPTHQFYTNGVCDNGNCVNDCNILGYQECSSITSFQICGQYDTDSCLEYSGDFGCAVGNVCTNGYCISNVGNGLTNNTLFTVTPFSVSSNLTSYSLDTTKKELTVNTKNLFHTQTFNTQSSATTSYSSRTCNYIETLIGNDIQNIYTNETQTVVFASLAQPTLISSTFLPNDTIINYVVISDALGSQITNYTIIRNISNKEVCIYNSTSSLVYCSYSSNTFDDLVYIQVIFNLEFQSKTFTTTFNLNRAQPTSFSTQPKAFSDNDVTSISIMSDGMFYFNSSVVTYTQPVGFSTTLKNNYNYLQCIYNSIGCRTVRTYNNFNGISDFTNYYDYKICVSSLSASVLPTPETCGLFCSLTIAQKYWIMLVSSVLIVILMTILVASFGDGLAGLLVGLVMSMITSLTLTIIFGLTLLIPILYILIGGAIVAMLMRRIFAGG